MIEQLRMELCAKQEQLESKTAKCTECERNQSMIKQLQKEHSNKQQQPNKGPTVQEAEAKCLSVSIEIWYMVYIYYTVL